VAKSDRPLLVDRTNGLSITAQPAVLTAGYRIEPDKMKDKDEAS
jgi:hypothetical protein